MTNTTVVITHRTTSPRRIRRARKRNIATA
jgi:hypothetical protein